ncbi:autophagy-related protein 13 [Crepidotus variabilis]|uniref:Autophagy-related protein 13 n=1 Tax=Crepidotus variabilis TaxID=179855 RepID=A0A9P6JU25_9AGAR|nr:autophagy-related protein 13 [Crepidotus variabilis]
MTDAQMTDRADQLSLHLYSKLFYLLNEARSTDVKIDENRGLKIDKWFCIETPTSDLFSKGLQEPYRNISKYLSESSNPPLLEIDVVLEIPELDDRISVDTSEIRFEPKPRLVVLEKWKIECIQDFQRSRANIMEDADLSVPMFCKNGMMLFRGIFSLLRLLPAWKLYQDVPKRTQRLLTPENMDMKLRLVFPGSEQDDLKRFRFEDTPSFTPSSP